jgi:NTP pyrophosphatase (non-canonical NTP hydrolase)
MQELIEKMDDLRANLFRASQTLLSELNAIDAAKKVSDRSISHLQAVAHKIAIEHGWHDRPRGVPECLALIHSEVSEALEEFRNGRDLIETRVSDTGKPEGFPVEIADVVIRCFDLAGSLGFDLEKVIVQKMNYNESRPYRHGNKAA